MSDYPSTDDLAKILWDYNALNQQLKKADCILVLGSNDIRVAQRGAKLFLEGYAPLLIFSGNVGKLTEGMWDRPEAEMFAKEAIKMGVPKEKILIENKSTNSGENIRFTRQLVETKNISINSIIVVQKPYMQRRAYATCKKIWPEKHIILTAPQISYEEYPNDILSKESVINVLVGDTQRIKVYGENGLQISQEIPENVWTAYKELLKRGYTNHLV